MVTLTTAVYSVAVVARGDIATTLRADVEQLASHTLESNSFAEPWLLFPALEWLDRDRPLVAVAIRAPGGLLVAVFIFVLEKSWRHVPLPSLRTWEHLYCFLGTPLVHRTHAPQAIEAFALWIESGRGPAHIVDWADLAWAGTFATVLRDCLARRSWSTDLATSERALLVRDPSPAIGISGRHAKELRRLERRLAESGTVTYRAIAASDDVEPWIKTFLELENAGWKGRGASAIAQQPDHRSFFTQAVRNAHALGKLQFLQLDVAGRPIASKCNFLADHGAYSFKIAFDEQFAKFSPGVLLELYNMRCFAELDHTIMWMDSCAIPNHPMIDRLWIGRRAIASYTTAGGSWPAVALVWLLPYLRHLKRRLRG